MNPTLRPARPEDADVCGEICYEAFKAIAEQHNFPPDFPSPQVAVDLLRMLLAHPEFYAVVAEADGRILGSNFLDERSTIAGLGPITVSPTLQNSGVGRRLMQALLDRAAERRFAGVRLVQAGYHNRSLSLYAKLGFSIREPLALMQGAAVPAVLPGYAVRAATESDLAACNRVCRLVHGHDRGGELRDAIRQGTATVVEHDGRITGYATAIGFFAHAVGQSNAELKALIGAAPVYLGSGFLVPTRNTALFRWCLDHDLRMVQSMTLMTTGLYNEPAGACLPSVLY
ncbi:GNAT family N-acetyltransferase [Immundisolibacter sp.]|uniref:GNAT family N-acetyltransferase n=1 Tax=Immundisolibacter sp. TaxID=1934948 RepID=UPI00356B2255